MKKFLALFLAAVMLACLSAVPAGALSDADNGNISVFATADAYSGFMEYESLKTVFGFDVRGYMEIDGEKELVGSTFDNHGYHTFLNVDGANGPLQGILCLEEREINTLATEAVKPIEKKFLAGAATYSEYIAALNEKKAEYRAAYEAQAEGYDIEAALAAMSYNCAGSLIQNIGGLNLKLENSYAGDGKYVKISYTVSNPTDEDKTFSLATTADVKIGNDDNATLKMLPGGVGAKLISDTSNGMFTLDGSEGGLDSVWIGAWEENYFRHMFDDSHDEAAFSGEDSAICWGWTNRVIPKGEALNFYVYIEVGMNGSPVLTVDDNLNNVGEMLDGYISDPNLGTVTIHYIVDEGEEQTTDAIAITGEKVAFALPMQDLMCGVTHKVKLWAVDDAGETSDTSIVTVAASHKLIDPVVEFAPSAEANGLISYTCERCSTPYVSVMCFGDASMDGLVNSIDAAVVLKYDAGLETGLTPAQLTLADVTGDGMLNSLDAAQILKYDAMLITSFANAAFNEESFAQLCRDYYGYYTGDTEEPLEMDTELVGTWYCDTTGETYEFADDNTGGYKSGADASATNINNWGIVEEKLYMEMEGVEEALQYGYTVLGDYLVIDDGTNNLLFEKTIDTDNEDSSDEESSSNKEPVELYTLKQVSDYLNSEKENDRLTVEFLYNGLEDLSAQQIARATGTLYVSYRRSGNRYEVDLYEYPGEHIADAFFEGDTSGLTADELKLFTKVLPIVAKGLDTARSDYELELFFHDYIIDNVDYYIGPTYVNDPNDPPRHLTAVGALIDGVANCQGYTDAFYLLGTMAGLDVGKMCAIAFSNGGGHMFNTVKLDGQYYILDATYDDVYEKVIDYRLFNAGKDMCDEYFWDETMEYHHIANASDSHYFYKHSPNRWFTSLEDMAKNIANGYQSGKTLFQAALIGESFSWQELDSLLYEELNRKGVSFSYTIWANNNGFNTFYTIIFE